MPKVSIILPTYNRASFLPRAFESIRSQKFTDWELIVVDDGSTDRSRDVIEQELGPIQQPARYIHQENQGAYGARKTGLEHASSQYIAFYDSDDCWLPHHLKDCVEALEANPDVDWAYGASQVVLEKTRETVAANTFYVDGVPRPFMRLSHRQAGGFRIIDDPRAAECMVRHGLYNGLQNSVIKRSLLMRYPFDVASRNEAEDQLLVVRALRDDCTVGYLDKVHVYYFIHDQNSSAVSMDGRANLEKRRCVYRALIKGFELLLKECRGHMQLQRELKRRISRELFWSYGYTLLWREGERHEAGKAYRKALGYWPWDLRCWKTYTLSQARTAFTR